MENKPFIDDNIFITMVYDIYIYIRMGGVQQPLEVYLVQYNDACTLPLPCVD